MKQEIFCRATSTLWWLLTHAEEGAVQQLIGIPRPISSYCFYKDICPSPNLYPNLLQLPILHLYDMLILVLLRWQYLCRNLSWWWRSVFLLAAVVCFDHHRQHIITYIYCNNVLVMGTSYFWAYAVVLLTMPLMLTLP